MTPINQAECTLCHFTLLQYDKVRGELGARVAWGEGMSLKSLQSITKQAKSRQSIRVKTIDISSAKN